MTISVNERRPSRPSQQLEGVGLGLRSPHIDQILRERPAVPWFELLADNHLASGGIIRQQLESIRANYPISLHCVGMSLGGCDPLDFKYLKSIRRLLTDYEASQVSDHLCFTQIDGQHLHELLPLPYTRESFDHVCQRVEQVQDFLGQPLLIENVSSYLDFTESSMSEAEFLSALVKRCGCRLLLDINNIYVNTINLGISAESFLDTIPLSAVDEIHLAGYEDHGEYLLDAHNNPVSVPVWELYEQVIQQAPDIPTLIEWDNDIPVFDLLQEEARSARNIITKYRAVAA